MSIENVYNHPEKSSLYSGSSVRFFCTIRGEWLNATVIDIETDETYVTIDHEAFSKPRLLKDVIRRLIPHSSAQEFLNFEISFSDGDILSKAFAHASLHLDEVISRL